MGKTVHLAAIAAPAAATLGIQTGTTSANGSAAPADRGSDLGSQAVQALERHPAIARIARSVQPEAEQDFVVTDTLTDRDGGTHVRIDRTYGGLPVLGGDIVVHQGANGTWEGASQTLAAPLTLSVTPVLTAVTATARALATRQGHEVDHEPSCR